jgi:nucleoside-diphosphate-sugar epimerase
MKVLFIGGTGIISSACTQLAIDKGIDLYVLNRGKTAYRPIPEGAHVITSDINDEDRIRKEISGLHFDSVVDWIVYTKEQLERDLRIFKKITGQYIFISSASVYQKPIANLPITESTLIDNPFWLYSQNKIACEERLVQAYHQDKFPMTIVRPSHTYDRTLLPFDGGYTVIDRMRKGKKVIVHGDGTSLWTLTHHRDFAVGFVGLLGNPHAIGDVYHITSDESLPWNQIYEIMARAACVEPRLVHVPSELIAAFDPEWGAGLLGDKAHSVIFDNSKIKHLVPEFKAVIPFSRGAEEIMAWYDADPARQVVDPEVDRMHDRIIEAYEKAWPK